MLKSLGKLPDSYVKLIIRAPCVCHHISQQRFALHWEPSFYTKTRNDHHEKKEAKQTLFGLWQSSLTVCPPCRLNWTKQTQKRVLARLLA